MTIIDKAFYLECLYNNNQSYMQLNLNYFNFFR